MADKYWFSSGGFIDIQGISITPNINARVQALCFFSGGIVQMKFVDIVGDEYTKWASDDDYLIALVGYKLGMGERVQPTSNLPDIVNIKPFTPYTFPSGLPVTVAPDTVAPETVAPDAGS